jgi:hypothetical protein
VGSERAFLHHIHRHARFIFHMADAVGFEKISKVPGARGWSKVAVKWQVSSLKMGNDALNDGRKGLWFQAGLEHTIEELVRNACLEPEQASIVMEFRLGKAAKERTLGNEISIKSQWNCGRRNFLHDTTHLLIDVPSRVEFISINGLACLRPAIAAMSVHAPENAGFSQCAVYAHCSQKAIQLFFFA